MIKRSAKRFIFFHLSLFEYLNLSWANQQFEFLAEKFNAQKIKAVG